MVAVCSIIGSLGIGGERELHPVFEVATWVESGCVIKNTVSEELLQNPIPHGLDVT